MVAASPTGEKCGGEKPLHWGSRKGRYGGGNWYPGWQSRINALQAIHVPIEVKKVVRSQDGTLLICLSGVRGGFSLLGLAKGSQEHLHVDSLAPG